MVVDIISLIIASAAIIVSIITAYKTDQASKKITNKTFEKEYFDALFRDFMLKTFPIDILEKVEWKENDVNDRIVEVEGILDDFLRQIKAYQYLKKDLYDKVVNKISEIEDCVYEMINAKEQGVLDSNLHARFRSRMEEANFELYTIFKEAYEC